MKTNISRYRKRDLSSLTRVLLALLMGVVLVTGASGQAYWEKGGSKAKVEFIVSSEYLDASKRLSSLNNEIDLNQYPDAKIMIRVDAEELEDRYNFHICPSCYRDNLPGLRYKEKNNVRIQNTEDHAYIIYEVAPDAAAITGNLILSLRYRKGGKKEDEKQFSTSYTIVPKRPAVTAAEPVDTEAASASGPPPENASVTTASDRRAAANKFWQDNQLSSDRRYQEIKDNKVELRKHRDAYYFYSRNYKGLDPARDRHATASVKTIVERLKYVIGEEQKGTEAAALTETIRKNFTSPIWTPDEENRNRFYYAYQGIGDQEITLVTEGCPAGAVQIDHQPEKQRFVLTATGEVECVVYPTFPAIDLSLNEPKYRRNVDTKAPPLSVKFVESNDGDVRIEASGGKAPYTVHLYDASGTIHLSALTGLDWKEQDDDRQIANLAADPASAIRQQLDAADYIIRVLDDNGISSRETARYTLQPTLLQRIGPWLLGIAALLIGGLIYWQYERSRRSTMLTDEEVKAMEENRKANQGNNGKPIELPQKEGVAAASTVQSKIKVGRKTLAGAVVAAGAGADTAPRHPQPRALSGSLTPLQNQLLIGRAQDYLRVDTQEVWKKSLVSQIYLHRRFIYRIDEFVFENKAIQEQQREQVPEIGGWILGRKVLDSASDRYWVSFERFISIERPRNSTTQLAFDYAAWRSLEDGREMYKDQELELVGWFHTHPGWGVFLSHEDVNSQESFFKERYHIAMEMESLNEPHEVGFFTWYREPDRLMLNNRAEQYHRWTDFQDWLNNKQ
jgi:proteasome lid subunit RPN8/RPN11